MQNYRIFAVRLTWTMSIINYNGHYIFKLTFVVVVVVVGGKSFNIFFFLLMHILLTVYGAKIYRIVQNIWKLEVYALFIVHIFMLRRVHWNVIENKINIRYLMTNIKFDWLKNCLNIVVTQIFFFNIKLFYAFVNNMNFSHVIKCKSYNCLRELNNMFAMFLKE